MPTQDRRAPQIAKDLGITDSCLQNWMAQADAGDGKNTARLSGEKTRARRAAQEASALEMENDVLKRAAAYFARENVLPK